MKKILILFCFALVFGQNGALEFAEILELAKRNNHKILSEKAKTKAAAEHIRAIGVLPEPQLSAGYFIEPIKTKTGPQEFRLGLMQKLPWFGKLSNQKKIAVLQHEQSILKFWKTELELEQSIFSTIFELRFLDEKIQILEDNLALILQIEHVVQTAYSTGKSHHSDVIRIAIEREKLQNEIQKATDEQSVKWFDFELLIGEKISEIPKQIPRITTNGTLENNPTHRIAEIEKSIAELQTKLTNLAFFPDVALGADWIFTDGGENPILAKIGLNLPIHFRKNIAQKKKALQIEENKTAEIFANWDKLKSLEKQLENKISDTTNDKILVAETLIPLAKEHLHVAEIGFLAGEISFSDYLDAQKTIFDLQLNLSKSQRDLNISQSKLAELFGSGESKKSKFQMGEKK